MIFCKFNKTIEFVRRNASNNTGDDKPFTCPVPGCKKKYKNVNGIKYHAKNGHKKDTSKYVFAILF
jgi:hypothetical protein